MSSCPGMGCARRTYAAQLLAAERDGGSLPDPAAVSGEVADPAAEPSRPAAGGFTSHLSVGDRDGGLVSMTTTQLNSWGARVLDPETGVLFNNGMGYFDPRPGARNGIKPGVSVLSAMSPTILCEDRGPVAAVGASGGPRIISGVAQIIAALATGRVTAAGGDRGAPHPRRDQGRGAAGQALAGGDSGGGGGGRLHRGGRSRKIATSGNFARPNGVLIEPDGRRRSGVDPDPARRRRDRLRAGPRFSSRPEGSRQRRAGSRTPSRRPWCGRRSPPRSSRPTRPGGTPRGVRSPSLPAAG